MVFLQQSPSVCRGEACDGIVPNWCLDSAPTSRQNKLQPPAKKIIQIESFLPGTPAVMDLRCKVGENKLEYSIFLFSFSVHPVTQRLNK